MNKFCTFAYLTIAFTVSSVQAQEVVTSHSVSIQHIKGCITLNYPEKEPITQQYSDSHQYSTIRRSGGLIGGVNYVSEQITKSRSGKNYSKTQLQNAGYKNAGKSGKIETFTRNFLIKRRASVQVCVKPSIDLSKLIITMEARHSPVSVSVKSDPGKPASQMISAKTATAIDADNKNFKQQFDAELKKTIDQINKINLKMDPSELAQLWDKNGIGKTADFNFFNSSKHVEVRLRKVEKN